MAAAGGRTTTASTRFGSAWGGSNRRDGGNLSEYDRRTSQRHDFSLITRRSFADLFEGEKRLFLIKNIDVEHGLLDMLHADGVLTYEHLDDITSCRTNRERVSKLLDILRRVDGRFIPQFYSALDYGNQSYIVEELKKSNNGKPDIETLLENYGIHPDKLKDILRGHSKKVVKEHTRLELRKNFFTQRVVNGWNRLPQQVVDAPSTNSFKNGLDKYWQDMDSRSD